MTKLPFAISIPHGGTDVPEEFADLVVATPDCTKEDVDHLTREICSVPEGRVQHFLTFSTSRTYVDLNRPPESFGQEHPDGVVKRETHLGKQVFDQFPKTEVVKSVIDRLYHPYHERLQKAVKDPNVKLTLDCHSMSPTGLTVSPDSPGQSRPPICVGHKSGLTASREMVDGLRQVMSEVYQVSIDEIAVDKPFNGGYITRTHGSLETPMIQVEFSRGFYMPDQVGQPSPTLNDKEIALWSGRFLETLERLAKLPIFR